MPELREDKMRLVSLAELSKKQEWKATKLLFAHDKCVSSATDIKHIKRSEHEIHHVPLYFMFRYSTHSVCSAEKISFFLRHLAC